MAGVLDTVNHRYQVTIWEREHTANRLIAWLGDQPPTPTGGGGGHQVITLPKRSAVTVWQGRTQPVVLSLPIMLWDEQPEPVAVTMPGGWGGRATGQPHATSTQMEKVSTAAQTGRLIRMWRPSDDTIEPPVIRVRAPNNLVPYQQLPFVLTDFQWGAAVGNDDGERVVQQLVLVLTEYRQDERLQTIKAHVPRIGSTGRVYRVRAGDTLTSVAKRFHVKNGWRQLGDAQHPPITDPRNIRVGQKLLIP